MPEQEKARTIQVLPLQTPTTVEKKAGRPRKLKMPPLPEEVFEGMTALEKAHFDFFIASFLEDYPGMTPSDILCLHQAAIEYVNLLRVQATQMRTGQVISMARQHPGVQLRQWLDAMSVTRKQRTAKAPEESKDKADLRELLESIGA